MHVSHLRYTMSGLENLPGIDSIVNVSVGQARSFLQPFIMFFPILIILTERGYLFRPQAGVHQQWHRVNIVPCLVLCKNGWPRACHQQLTECYVSIIDVGPLHTWRCLANRLFFVICLARLMDVASDASPKMTVETMKSLTLLSDVQG